MKRKAPETLLEFSDYYLHPATKKFKFTPEPLEPLVFSSQPMREYAYESDFHSSPVSSPSYHNSCESDSAEEVAASPPQRRRSNSVESIGDFSLEEFLAQDPLADKPSNSRKPLKSLVHAIRWITENKRVLQKEISDAVGVRCVHFMRIKFFLWYRHVKVSILKQNSTTRDMEPLNNPLLFIAQVLWVSIWTILRGSTAGNSSSARWLTGCDPRSTLNSI